MKLMELALTDYLAELRSESPAPGGGSVCALAGAQGMSLLMMVCGLTITREKYAEHHETCKKALEKAEAIGRELADLVDLDTEAYLGVAAAFKLPKETEEEKGARSAAIIKATHTATEVPFRVMELSLAGLELAGELMDKTNPNAASDLGVAGQNLSAALKGAYYNVLINLSGLKDQSAEETFRDTGMKMVERGTLLLTIIEDHTEKHL